MKKIILGLTLLASLSEARQLSKIEIIGITTELCQNKNEKVLLDLEIADGGMTPSTPSEPVPPPCEFTEVFCRTANKNFRRIDGFRVPVRNCQIKATIVQALDVVWQKCGGINTDRCVKPAECYGIDSSGYEKLLGKYATETDIRNY